MPMSSPDAQEARVAHDALPHVRRYPDDHPEDLASIPVIVEDDHTEVSRPHLIGLLKADEIAYRKVGTRRRVRADSLLDYLRRDDQRRREAADELAAMTQEPGFD